MIKTLDIDMEIDLHESSPEYAVNNATVAHERASAIASEGRSESGVRGHFHESGAVSGFLAV